MLISKTDFGLNFLACLETNARIEAAQAACEDGDGNITDRERWFTLSTERLDNAATMADCVLDLIAYAAGRR